MSTHSPGPWIYEVHQLSEGYSGIVYDANGYRVGTDHLSEADAALIAAAPVMLAALKALAADAKWQNAPHDLLRQARDAIVKAEGLA